LDDEARPAAEDVPVAEAEAVPETLDLGFDAAAEGLSGVLQDTVEPQPAAEADRAAALEGEGGESLPDIIGSQLVLGT
jgi:hypothetical protein